MARDKNKKDFDPRLRSGIVLTPPMYIDFIIPLGYLTRDPACHALFHYFNTAIQNYKSQAEGGDLEGARTDFNYHQLYLSIAKLFSVDPNEMGKYWPAVNLQAGALGLSLLPEWLRDPKRGLS